MYMTEAGDERRRIRDEKRGGRDDLRRIQTNKNKRAKGKSRLFFARREYKRTRDAATTHERRFL